METHRVQTTLEQDGTLVLRGLPFQAGQTVEVVILPAHSAQGIDGHPLYGAVVTYTDPFKPVAEDDWEALG